jgi:glycerol-1-phosphate dehydrogenase [NAD(P)+]
MIEPTGGHRTIRIPRLMRLVRGPAAVVDALGELGGGPGRLLVVDSGARSATGYGTSVQAQLAAAGHEVIEHPVEDADEPSVAAVAGAIDDFRPDYVLGIGGGRIIDVAKLAAARRSAEVVTIPTQFASDAICSPVAIIRSTTGERESVGARMPAAIVVDLDVVDSAPRSAWLAGLGDLVSNLSAVRDWRAAQLERNEPFDDFAALTSEAAAWSVVEEDADLGDADYRNKVLRGLILSGLAMEMAGSSRPASGSEHLVSHALDRILERPRAHGLQVALGTIAVTVLRDDDPTQLVGFFRRTGLPVLPAELGIGPEDVVAAVRRGPGTRPGRRTALDAVGERDLDRLRDFYRSAGA